MSTCKIFKTGATEHYLEGCVYSFIQGVTSVLPKFRTSTEKIPHGSIIKSPVLCWNNTFLFCFVFRFQLSRMWWCQMRIITCKESWCLLYSTPPPPTKAKQYIYISIFYKHGNEDINHILTSTWFALKNVERKSWGCTLEKQKKDMAVAKRL